MQFTSAGLSELKHQFGLAGSDQHSKGVPEILKAKVKRFYAGNTKKETEFHVWMKSSISNQKQVLRSGKNIEADILAGALLLKIYLSVNNGNYIKALQQYNSSAKKIAYAQDAFAVATKVELSDDACFATAQFAESIVVESCEVNEDEACMPQDESLSLPWSNSPRVI